MCRSCTVDIEGLSSGVLWHVHPPTPAAKQQHRRSIMSISRGSGQPKCRPSRACWHQSTAKAGKQPSKANRTSRTSPASVSEQNAELHNQQPYQRKRPARTSWLLFFVRRWCRVKDASCSFRTSASAKACTFMASRSCLSSYGVHDYHHMITVAPCVCDVYDSALLLLE